MTTLPPSPTSTEIRAAERHLAAIIADGGNPPAIGELIAQERATRLRITARKEAEAAALPAAIEAIRRHIPTVRSDRPDSLDRLGKVVVGEIVRGVTPRDAIRSLIWEPSQNAARSTGGTGYAWAE